MKSIQSTSMTEQKCDRPNHSFAGSVKSESEVKDSAASFVLEQNENKSIAEPRKDIAEEDYSSFSIWQRKCIILSASLVAWLSPMTGSIYYPALNEIAKDLNVSASDINLTVTTYLIFQGLGPMIIAGFSDRAGRRPAYILCFVIYIAANLGLGLQNSFPALLVLRMVQSAGSSGTVTLANGVVGDLVTSTERGKYIAWASLGTVLGPTLSPVLGGIISQNAPYQWLFWFCLILSGIFAVPFLLLFPETCRNVVGDGSIPPPRLSWNLTDFLRYRKQARQGRVVDQEKMEKVRKQYKLHLPNPWPTLVILSNPEAAVLLLTTGIAFACYYAISTGASVVFADVYGLDPLEVGLIFLSLGIGSLISAFTTGKLVDLNYRRYARKHNLPIRKNRYTDLSDFPIERARMEPALPLFVMGMAAIIGYGWIMTVKVSLAGPIILLFVLGYSLMAGFQCMNVLMIDIYPSKPAAASAASNVVRCLLAAAASAAIEPMSQATGYGWAYTVLAFIFLLACLLLLPVMKYGIQLRRRLKAIDERKAEKAMRS